MSGHENHEVAQHEEDHSIQVKVAIFFVFVIISLFAIATIN
jgi:hypothetical protein